MESRCSFYRRGATALLVLAIGVAFSGAQVLPPGGPPNYVLFDGAPAAVKGLEYSATEKKAPWTAPGTQYAEFSLSLQYEAPQFWQETGLYEWQPLWAAQTEEAPLMDGVLAVQGDGTARTATGSAYEPGVYTVTCLVQIEEIGNTSNKQWVTLRGDCAVIGGPLTLTVSATNPKYPMGNFGSGSVITYNYPPPSTEVNALIPAQDENDFSRPFHLQFFGFDPTGPIPTDYQVPRADGWASAELQPEGTVFDWTVSGAALDVTGGGTSYSHSVKVTAIEAGSGTVTCEFSLQFVGMNGTAYGETMDDTTETPQNVDDTPIPMMVNAFNSHQPTDTIAESTKPYWPSDLVNSSGIVLNGDTFSGMVAEIKLVSQLGVRMPGVWVQERFTTSLPPNYQVNQNGGPTWATAGLEDEAHLGQFYWDHLWYHWPNLPGTQYVLDHVYWAATKSTVSGGIDVGTWEITLTPGQAWGLGTVTHVRIN